MTKEAEDVAPSDPAEFAAAVNGLCAYLSGNRARPFKGNSAREVRQVAFGLNLFREMLDSYAEKVHWTRRPATGLMEAYAILDHLETGRAHPVATHVRGIHSGKFRPQHMRVHKLEAEGRMMLVGFVRAYAQTAKVSSNAARTKAVAIAAEEGISFTNGQVMQWERRADQSGSKEDLEKWENEFIRLANREPNWLVEHGRQRIAAWWRVAQL
jgi:hypothetical protein